MVRMKRVPRKSKTPSVYPTKDPKKSAMIIAIGAALMIGGHLAVWEYDKYVASQKAKQVSEEVIDDFQEHLDEMLDQASAEETSVIQLPQVLPREEYFSDNTSEVVRRIAKAWEKWSPKKKPEKKIKPGAPKKIVIIIDDMGVSRKLSKETLELPGPLTLAFLPYASGLKSITKEARDKGHELMIHMPMEPINSKLDVGSIALLDDMKEKEINKALDEAFASFEGYVGINNHMGSKVTQNKEIMDLVMERLTEKDLLFVDSKTISTSLAGAVAAQHGLDYAERDVFLDHHDNDEFVKDSLSRVEAVARRRGYAIAIGHPKSSTIKNLKEWLPTLKEKGFEIVPISEVVKNDRSIKLSEVQPPKAGL